MSSFAEKARLLQSIWRVEKGFKFEKYGNFLKEDFAKETGSDFLSKNIFGIIKTEVKNKHIDGKVIKEPRIWNNLLSSQPLAFNLFGELKLNTKIATSIFQELYPERNLRKVSAIEFEYSPAFISFSLNSILILIWSYSFVRGDFRYAISGVKQIIPPMSIRFD